MIRQGSYDDLMRQIGYCVSRDIPVKTGEAIRAELENAGWPVARAVTEAIRRANSIPTNLFGYVTRLIEENRARLANHYSSQPDGENKDGEYTPADPAQQKRSFMVSRLMFEIIGEVQLHHDAGLAHRQETTLRDPYPDVVEWDRMGRPKTWSPLVDALFAGYYRAMRLDKTCEALLDFMLRFKRTLWERRMRHLGVKVNGNAGTGQAESTVPA